MKVISERDSVELPLDASVVTVGTYDGIHFGHRRIMASIVRQSADLGVPSVVVSFDRHPLSVVRPGSEPLRLTDSAKQAELLQGLGVDYLLLLTFDEDRAEESAEDFITGLLVRTLGTRRIFVGADFHFGKGRRGDLPMLQTFGKTYGFSPGVIPLSVVGEVLGEDHPDSAQVVSSSLIRSYLTTGRLDEANRLLGRPHCLRGVVVGGDRRGSGELGFPTANLEMPYGIAVPSDGVYAGYLSLDHGASRYRAAISVGTRPTYYPEGAPRLIESFVLDFDENLYGKTVEVGFQSLLRAQETFGSSEELRLQIEKDVEQVSRL